FNKSHIPAFMADETARNYVCVYPFVRSYDWYVMDDAERRDMLREHGQMARDYPDVRANTVASFALGDYEWLLGFEADELHRIVDLMRELRGSRARRHVREEVPFVTGRRRPVADIGAALPCPVRSPRRPVAWPAVAVSRLASRGAAGLARVGADGVAELGALLGVDRP